MDTSILSDKSYKPSIIDLEVVLTDKFNQWVQIRNLVFDKYPMAIEEWNYPGKKYGWSFRIKDKKRAIIYLLPRETYFKVAFVFGEKATNQILESNIDKNIKTELSNSRKYAEGRGIQIDVNNESIVTQIEKLITIKLAN